MLGAIIGDIVGSRYEFRNHKGKEFDLFTRDCEPTDDSIMTLAVAQAIMKSTDNQSDLSEEAVKYMQKWGRIYPRKSYGNHFRLWLKSDAPEPYNSYGNGAAMRISPVGFAAADMREVINMSRAVTKVSHNHPEGIKGAEATAVAVFMAHSGKSMNEIRDYIDQHYYPMNFTLDDIRENYQMGPSCQGTVPPALMAFFESTGFEDAIRNAVSIGGDSDTIAAITGGIAEAYYGIPKEIIRRALDYLDERQTATLIRFESRYSPKMGKIIKKEKHKTFASPKTSMPRSSQPADNKESNGYPNTWKQNGIEFILLFILWYFIIPELSNLFGFEKTVTLFLSNFISLIIGVALVHKQFRETTAKVTVLSVLIGIPAAIFINYFSYKIISFFGYSSTTNGQAIGQLAKGNPLLLLFTMCILGPINEEILFRGLLFRTLKYWKGKRAAYIVSSLVFGILHCTTITEPRQLIMAVPYVMMGFLLAFIYERGGIRSSVAVHIANNIIATI